MKKRKGFLSVLCGVAILLTACGSSSIMESANMAVSDSFYYDDSYDKVVEESYPEYKLEYSADEEYGLLASGSTTNGTSSNVATGTEASTKDSQSNGETIINGEKLVYTCNISMETLEFEGCILRIRDNIDKYEGFIERENESDSASRWYYDDYVKTSGTKYMSLTVRIPTKYYDEFLSGIEGTDKVTSRNSYVENISRKYYDTSAKIEALKIQQERLLEMLSKATKVEDMITIESRLSEVQYQLNAANTSLASMDADVAFSTITIDIQEVMEYTPSSQPAKHNTFGDRLKNTLSETWEFFWEMLEFLLFAVIRLIPLLILGLVVTVLVVLMVKNHKKKKMKKMEELQRQYLEKMQNQQQQ